MKFIDKRSIEEFEIIDVRDEFASVEKYNAEVAKLMEISERINQNLMDSNMVEKTIELKELL